MGFEPTTKQAEIANLLGSTPPDNLLFLSAAVPVDLSPEERSELEDIRRRKGALLMEIQRLREELREAIMEVEGLESSTEGR
uniref:Cytohesin Ubiquitin Protein Inducing domain-containing protein n=1 Tax=Paramormyrops kingsleyae TaxID=1676925 RepID=A0A3B3SJB6_9TELE